MRDDVPSNQVFTFKQTITANISTKHDFHSIMSGVGELEPLYNQNVDIANRFQMRFCCKNQNMHSDYNLLWPVR